MRHKAKINAITRLLESKDHLIDKLDLTDGQKTELKDFFKKHPNYESKIDWNNKSLQYKDFANLLDQEGKSKSQAKKKGIEGLTEGKDYLILEQNDKYTLYQITTHLGSKTIAGPKVEPLEVTGQWCIAMNDPKWWQKYRFEGNEFFFVCFKDTKYAISEHFFVLDDPAFTFFNAVDTEINQLTLDWAKEVLDIIEAKGKITSGRTIASDGLVYLINEEGCHLVNFDYGHYGINRKNEWEIEKPVIRADCKMMAMECLNGDNHIKSIKTALNSQLQLIEPYALKRCGFLHTIDFSSATQLTEIPEEFSALNSDLKLLLLPHSVRKIDDRAFTYCQSLEHMILPDDLEIIGQNAFSLAKVRELRFPKNVREIGDNAFYNCRNLTLLDFSENEGMTYFSGHMFTDCHAYADYLPKKPLVIKLSRNMKQLKALSALFESVDIYRGTPDSNTNPIQIIIESPLPFAEVGEEFFQVMKRAVSYVSFSSPGTVIMTLKCPDKEVSVQNE